MTELAYIVLASITLLAVFNIIRAYKQKDIIHIMPGACWLIGMVIPFALNVTIMHPDKDIIMLQSIGISMIFAALVIPEHHILQKEKTKTTTNQEHTKPSILEQDWVILACLGLSLLIACLHIYRIGNLPILDALFSEMSAEEIGQQRAIYSRDSQVSIIEKYVYSFHAFVFAAPAIGMLFAKKKYIATFFSFSMVMIYLILSTAKLPLFEFLWIFAFILCYAICKKALAAYLRAMFIGGVSILLLSGLYLAHSNDNNFLYKAIHKQNDISIPLQNEIKPTIGDYDRYTIHQTTEQRLPILLKLIKFGYYRMIFTPFDVSHRWYEYYTKISPATGFKSIISHRSPETHPARLVDKWAFASRFPELYKNGYAYSSIDADAFGRKGLTGVAIIALILASIRIMLHALPTDQTRWSHIYAAIGLGLLSLLPISVSLQSMLIAHGLIVVILALIFFKIWHNMTLWRAQTPPQHL